MERVDDVIKRIWAPVVAALVAGLGIVGTVASPAQADDGVNVYVTPGNHEVNGRKWRTTCEKYSTTVERCRAEIWATQVRFVSGRYQEVTGWVFNNLTYKPSPREQWKGNPLAANGVVEGKLSWTSTEGRQWKTECDTAETGRNGCRSYIMSKDIVVKTMTPRTYERVDRWVFNNIVQFSTTTAPVPKVWCENAPLPYNMALRNRDGLPYYTTAPYTPKDVYNPNTVANFIKNVSRDGRLSDKQRTCMANLGGKHLIDGSHTEGSRDNTVRWYAYRFDFQANPTIPALSGQDGWFSGLAQGGVLSAMVEMNRITKDPKWLDYGRQTLRSFDVLLEDGGIKNYINIEGNDVLWFEEYPTSPATSVLNGHLEALIGLDIWYDRTGDPRAKELVDEALDGLEPALNQEQLDVQGGVLTSYDLVRGYWDKGRDYDPSPLRYVSAGGNGQVSEALLNDKDVTENFPRTSPSGTSTNLLADSGMDQPIFSNSASYQPGWQQVVSRSKAYRSGGRVVARTDGVGWQGVSQIVKANTVPNGKRVALSLDAQLTTPNRGTTAGASGKVAVYEQCPGRGSVLLFESQKMRSASVTDYTMSFTPRYVGCPMLVQLMTSSYGNSGTTISYDNVELRVADEEGPKLDIVPKDAPFAYVGQFVHSQPTNELTLKGSGRVHVEAYEDGRWQRINDKEIALSPTTPVTVQLPERITGRNIHYGYHEHHVDELVSLYKRSGRNYLRTYAESWVKMAPGKIGTVPAAPDARARTMSVPDPGDTYDIPIIDPFSMMEDEWSSVEGEELSSIEGEDTASLEEVDQED